MQNRNRQEVVIHRRASNFVTSHFYLPSVTAPKTLKQFEAECQIKSCRVKPPSAIFIATKDETVLYNIGVACVFELFSSHCGSNKCSQDVSAKDKPKVAKEKRQVTLTSTLFAKKLLDNHEVLPILKNYLNSWAHRKLSADHLVNSVARQYFRQLWNNNLTIFNISVSILTMSIQFIDHLNFVQLLHLLHFCTLNSRNKSQFPEAQTSFLDQLRQAFDRYWGALILSTKLESVYRAQNMDFMRKKVRAVSDKCVESPASSMGSHVDQTDSQNNTSSIGQHPIYSEEALDRCSSEPGVSSGDHELQEVHHDTLTKTASRKKQSLQEPEISSIKLHDSHSFLTLPFHQLDQNFKKTYFDWMTPANVQKIGNMTLIILGFAVKNESIPLEKSRWILQSAPSLHVKHEKSSDSLVYHHLEIEPPNKCIQWSRARIIQLPEQSDIASFFKRKANCETNAKNSLFAELKDRVKHSYS